MVRRRQRILLNNTAGKPTATTRESTSRQSSRGIMASARPEGATALGDLCARGVRRTRGLRSSPNSDLTTRRAMC